MLLYRDLIETPVGPMRLLATDSALCSLEFYNEGRMARLDRRVTRWFDDPEFRDEPNAVVERTKRWLDDYFNGASADISTIPIEMRGAPFELKVWAALRTIAPGTTTSYGAIAKTLGSPDASRAVGTANGANPIAIIVPCHRVIGSNGSLTGYGGGLDRKKWLLEHERRWSKEPALF